MRSLADSENFILVYPQALLEDGETNWNTLRDVEIGKLSADDIGFVASMIDTLAATYQVDTTRVPTRRATQMGAGCRTPWHVSSVIK